MVRALRPRQWIKNGAVFTSIVFQGLLFNRFFFWKGFVAFVYFCAITSAMYLINDYVDLEQDKRHPIKKNRPLASGKLPVSWALFTAGVLILFFLLTAWNTLGSYFYAVGIFYIILQLAYNLKLKKIIIIDAISIALGFILRVFAGALAVPLSISSWLVLAITGGALLMAFGKRRAERTLLQAVGISRESTRKILKYYPDSLLDSMISMSATFAIVTYSLFTFQEPARPVIRSVFEGYLPSTLIGAKFLMLTIPVVIYGVARYLYVIYEKREGESPERVLMRDKPLLFTTIFWITLVIITTNQDALDLFRFRGW